MNWVNESILGPPSFMRWSFTCVFVSQGPGGGNIELNVYNGDIFVANFTHGFLPELPRANVSVRSDTAYCPVACLNGIINQ